MSAYDDCTYCGGRVTERPVVKDCWWGDQLIALIEDVPAGVCEQCGERYYKPLDSREPRSCCAHEMPSARSPSP